MNSATPSAGSVATYFQRPPWSHSWVWFVLSAVILVADYLCEWILLFPIFFVFPVILAAWNGARREAIGIAIFLTVARFGASFLRDSESPMIADVVNGLVHCFVLVCLAVLVTRVARQSTQLTRQVKQLEGLIPICAHCKRVLDEEKHWTRLETYLTEHTEAQLTHGICPECAKTHYGIAAPNEASF